LGLGTKEDIFCGQHWDFRLILSLLEWKSWKFWKTFWCNFHRNMYICTNPNIFILELTSVANCCDV
jgi:hypothetical protein